MQVEPGLEAVPIAKEGKESCFGFFFFFLVNLPYRVIERIK